MVAVINRFQTLWPSRQVCDARYHRQRTLKKEVLSDKYMSP